MNLLKFKNMSGKDEQKRIGFRQEAEIKSEENETPEESNKESNKQKNQEALESIAKLVGGETQISANELMIMQKLQLYMDLIKSDDFITKSPEEKESFLAELMFLQSMSTELSVLKTQMQSVINK